MIERKERDCVRQLAMRMAELADESRMEGITRRWRDVNALRKPDRAPVWCRPVGCWNEIIPEDTLVCTTPWLRHSEYGFRQHIYKRDLDDDTPVDAFYEVPAVFSRHPENTWGVDVRRKVAEKAGGAWAYDPPLVSADDFRNLRIPEFAYDAGKTQQRLAQAQDLFEGILPVRLSVSPPLGATLGSAAADLRGLGQLMIDMAAEPELVHRLMTLLRDATLGAMDVAEDTGLLSPNNRGPMTCSDPIGEPGPNGKPTCKNLWCMANSQEFDAVSPAMWEEFCLHYQQPIFARFGFVGYGCCENLTHKIDGVLSIPNLRIFVCSAWTDLAKVIERAGRNYCIMWRQKASDVVFADEPAKVRQQLFDGAQALEGCRYQIVLRELQTLGGHPDRLADWTRFAKEAAEKYA